MNCVQRFLIRPIKWCDVFLKNTAWCTKPVSQYLISWNRNPPQSSVSNVIYVRNVQHLVLYFYRHFCFASSCIPSSVLRMPLALIVLTVWYGTILFCPLTHLTQTHSSCPPWLTSLWNATICLIIGILPFRDNPTVYTGIGELVSTSREDQVRWLGSLSSLEQWHWPWWCLHTNWVSQLSFQRYFFSLLFLAMGVWGVSCYTRLSTSPNGVELFGCPHSRQHMLGGIAQWQCMVSAAGD